MVYDGASKFFLGIFKTAIHQSNNLMITKLYLKGLE